MPNGIYVDTGDIKEVVGSPAGALNDLLIPPTDVRQYKWISLHLGPDVYDGILEPQISYDGSTWRTIKMYPMDTLDAGDVSSAGFNSTINATAGVQVFAPYFQVKMTSYTSGFATGGLQLFTYGLPGFQLLTTYARLLTNNGQIGFINNDGTQSLAVAAGHTGDTFITGPGMLGSILITATGSADLIFYDNNAASGTKIAFVPSAATVNGVPYVCHAPFVTGVFLAGSASNAGFTIFF